MSFLELPLELRLIIYGYAVLEGSAVTIGAAKLVGSESELAERQNGHDHSPLPGLPELHEPVIVSRYSSRLLSVHNPAQIDLTRKASPAASQHSTLRSLLLLNSQVHDEVKAYFEKKHKRETSCFISYPHGVHVLRKNGPDLIRQARSIHIAGRYTPQPSNTPTSTRFDQEIKSDAHPELASLVRATVGDEACHPVSKLEARFYFTGINCNSVIWADESPVTTILRNTGGCFIDMEVFRGRACIGVYVSVRPHPEDHRCISTVWKKLREGDHDPANSSQWTVDKNWPAWNGDHMVSPAVAVVW